MGRDGEREREGGGKEGRGGGREEEERKKERKKPSVVPLQAHALIFTFRTTLGIFLVIENHRALGKPQSLTSRAFLSLSLSLSWHTTSLRPERNLFQFVRRVKHWPRLTRDAGHQRWRGVPVAAESSELQHGPRLRFSSILCEKGLEGQALSG